ncbi:virulence factor family protein [Cystobacter fuscus]|uniref:Virulence factor family protein n=1 Tax=Cystobacter fuscus TaxID=43 RepID=A0A250JK75_9BACT|nr:AcvB/VirJ family lysyl-phosphatidylglycerol hydrolase [Cystobacter fuscus]ATB44279.1 virulence factor family protein [Cystobacter fuscus]
MNHLKGWVVMGALLAASVGGAADVGSTVSFGRFGEVALVRPTGAPSAVVLFLSGDAGWGAGERALAKELAGQGALVLGVRTPAYLAAVGAGKKCAYPAGDLEALSQSTQKKLGLPEYLHPVLLGTGAGAGLVYASLVQAPVNTFAGGVSLGFNPVLRMDGTLCRGSGLVRQRTREGERLGPFKPLSEPWRVLVGEKDTVFPVERARAFAEGVRRAEVTRVPGVGRGLVPLGGWTDAVLAAEAELARHAAPPPPVTATREEESGAPLEDVSDLPLIQVPAGKEGGDSLVVLLSGDGGWAGIDRDVASVLAAQGVPVVGWDSLRYFWKRRTPEATAKDLERVLAHYLRDWKKARVVLVGYSRGADVLPSVVAKLSAEARKNVQALALIAPGQEAELEVHVVDLLGGGGGEPILPAVKSLGGLPVVCLYGSDEASESLCPLLSDVPGARVLELEGGHHFSGDYAAVGRAILAPLREGQHL